MGVVKKRVEGEIEKGLSLKEKDVKVENVGGMKESLLEDLASTTTPQPAYDHER